MLLTKLLNIESLTVFITDYKIQAWNKTILSTTEDHSCSPRPQKMFFSSERLTIFFPAPFLYILNFNAMFRY